jgi:hypothetical protein
MRDQRLFWFTIKLLGWAPIILLSLLLSHNALLYFTHGGEYGILPEKRLAQNEVLWNIAFYLHLPSGIICLLTPIFLFQNALIKAGSNLHRIVGKLYGYITIFIVCPTGIVLALYAKGGLITQIGFVLQGILLTFFTMKASTAAKHHKISLHKDYIVRSFAIVAVVLSFRIYHLLFFFLNVPYADNYALSQWLGLAGNMLCAEIIIAMNRSAESRPGRFSPVTLK